MEAQIANEAPAHRRDQRRQRGDRGEQASRRAARGHARSRRAPIAATRREPARRTRPRAGWPTARRPRDSSAAARAAAAASSRRSSSASIAASVATAPASENRCGRSTKRSRPTNAAAASARALATAPAPRRRQIRNAPAKAISRTSVFATTTAGKTAVREDRRGADLGEPGRVEVRVVGVGERVEVATGQAVLRQDLLAGLEVEERDPTPPSGGARARRRTARAPRAARSARRSATPAESTN